MDQAGFTQAGIGIENRQAFQELQARIDRALGPAAEKSVRRFAIWGTAFRVNCSVPARDG